MHGTAVVGFDLRAKIRQLNEAQDNLKSTELCQWKKIDEYMARMCKWIAYIPKETKLQKSSYAIHEHTICGSLGLKRKTVIAAVQ